MKCLQWSAILSYDSAAWKFNVVCPLSGSLSLYIFTLLLLPMALQNKINRKQKKIVNDLIKASCRQATTAVADLAEGPKGTQRTERVFPFRSKPSLLLATLKGNPLSSEYARANDTINYAQHLQCNTRYSL